MPKTWHLLALLLTFQVYIQGAGDQSGGLATDTRPSVSMTILGIFGMITAVEKWGLHKRISLGILMLFGTKPHWLIFGMLMSTAILSMIITAGVTILMLPIVRSIMDKLKNADSVDGKTTGTDMELEVTEDRCEDHEETQRCEDHEETQNSTEKSFQDDEITNLYKALSLCISYGASLGSSAVLTGHPTNFITIGLTDELYGKYGLNSPITFISWLVLAGPAIVIILVLLWIWFVILFLGGKGLFRRATMTDAMQKAELRVNDYIKAEQRKLGPWKYPEIMSLVFLVLLVLVFLFEDLYFVPGWGSFFKPGFVGPAVPACLLTVLLFMVPAKSPKQLLCGKKNNKRDNRFEAIITWHDMEYSLPWGILIIIGSAFAMVEASKVSGLTKLLAVHFESFAVFEPWLLILMFTTITTFMTELLGNATTIAVILPIMGQVAISAGVDPVGLLLPLTLAANFAFMMPIATPPNAIAYSLGSLNLKDMIIAGFVVNILGLIVVNIGVQTWGKAYFHWDVLPEAMRLNNTIANMSISA